MIEVSELAAALIAGGHTSQRTVRVESWRDGELLADSVPVHSGREDVDRTARIPERVTLRMPRMVDGFDWSPGDDPDHPLAPYGQRLRIQLGLPAGPETEWIQRGEYLINDVKPERDEVVVTAVGLIALIEEARLVAPYQPTGTMVSTMRGLVEPALPAVFHTDLPDRAVPAAGLVNYDEDRLGAVNELLGAWPARARVTNTGYLLVEPDDPPDAADFTLDPATTLIRAVGGQTREGAYNVVVARGTASDGTQLQAVSYVAVGPLAYPGPFHPLPKPLYFFSPLLSSVGQCRAAAQTRRQRMLREYVAPTVADVVPLLHLEQTDAIDLGGRLYWLDGYSLPYTPGDGGMTAVLTQVAT